MLKEIIKHLEQMLSEKPKVQNNSDKSSGSLLRKQDEDKYKGRISDLGSVGAISRGRNG